MMLFSEEVYKRIQVTGSATETISPSSASITFTITSENEDLTKASQDNAVILEKYKSLLSKSNIKYEKIESISYNSNKTEYWDNVLVNKGEKEFGTALSIEMDIRNQDKLRDLVNILSSENINYFSKSNKGDAIYSFTINETDVNSKMSYQKALSRYKTLESKLLKDSIVSEVRIASYDTKETNKEKYDRVKKEKYRVTHVIKIKTRDVNNLGKLVNLGFTLNIQPNSYIQYDIDNKEQIESRLYEKAYLEAKKKAEKILAKTSLDINKPLVVTDNSRFNIQPYDEYFYNYNPLARKTEDVMKSSEKELIDLANKPNLTINPKKQVVTKTVNIEFQMDNK